MKKFRNILVVVKQTPYEQYMQLKNQGKAPVALRWGRLKNRYEVHQSCVNAVTGLLNNMDVTYSVLGREEMHRNVLADKDLVLLLGVMALCSVRRAFWIPLFLYSVLTLTPPSQRRRESRNLRMREEVGVRFVLLQQMT